MREAGSGLRVERWKWKKEKAEGRTVERKMKRVSWTGEVEGEEDVVVVVGDGGWTSTAVFANPQVGGWMWWRRRRKRVKAATKEVETAEIRVETSPIWNGRSGEAVSEEVRRGREELMV